MPLGTVIFAAVGAQGRPKRPGEQLADLRHNGDKFVAAAGGAGGLGNAALANKTRRAPGFALLGEPGEERDVILELKSIADVALVGFPSAGKSSLIAAMSAEGRSTIQNIDQIDRGYCNIDGRLNALGARITRCEECG